MRGRILLLIAAVVIALLMLVEMARAHSWYSRTNCCDGNDCAEVPTDAGWVVITEGGYQVTLTVEQAKLVNPDATVAIDVLIPWGDSRIKVPPPLLPGESYGQAAYHLCIAPSQNHVRCLFTVPGT